MSHKSKFLTAVLTAFCIFSMLFVFYYHTPVYAASGYEYVILNTYSRTMKIGDEYYLIALTSTGKKASFSSSDSSVASVNTYGKIMARKAGSAVITAKIKNGEASCRIKVQKTTITLNRKSVSLENGSSFSLTAVTSNGHPVTYKSSKKSIATVDEDGLITARKPGKTTIAVTADKTTVNCNVTVKQPSVSLSRKSVSLYRKGKIKLSVQTTSKSRPVWKSNKKSVATVDESGLVTAVKNGTATISVTVDGISRTCEVTVKKPVIAFENESIELSPKDTYQTKVTVSSGNKPVYSSSNTNIATVDENGKIHAKEAGKAYIYAKEDGVKARMTVIVK